ncbi:MAG: FAD-binding protein [Acidobacteria bacterium]|nr:FAD-binding protein [Acidobacteriota bacterium]
MTIDSVVRELRGALHASRVRDGALELSLYARDASVIEGKAAAVCFPVSTEEVQAAVRIAVAHGRAVVPRGSGTGLSGGAVPRGSDGLDPVVIVTTKMDRILEVNAEERVAWVEPGVLNLDLTNAISHLGLHFAPDPSSQSACTVGGNVANNAGGPHCLAYGVTSAHVLAVEVVLPNGETALLGGLDPEPPGYDLRGLFVGSEGCMGIATRIAVRLTPSAPAIKTLLADFTSLDDAARTVGDVIAAGVIPAAMEMMDARFVEVIERSLHVGFPPDAAAMLLVETDGLAAGTEAAASAIRSIAEANGARSVRVAADAEERALLWKGRKSAFGAIALIAPNYYLHDTVVPRTRLAEVLRRINDIADAHQLALLNVFHAGDGNLHPLLLFDKRVAGTMERVLDAGKQIIRVCVDAGGVLSGEHGIGLEKTEFMPWIFSGSDLDAQARARCAFDPEHRFNPHKVLPAGSQCGDLRSIPRGAWT